MATMLSNRQLQIQAQAQRNIDKAKLLDEMAFAAAHSVVSKRRYDVVAGCTCRTCETKRNRWG